MIISLLGLVSGQATELVIDPLLLVQAQEVWSVIAQDDNPIWPGWNAKDTPLLFYFPGKQEVLVNHPKPPEGFTRFDGAFRTTLGPMYVRSGQTTFSLDGQNTSTTIGDVRTLVVADTLSSRRQWIQSLVEQDDPARSESLEGGIWPNPYQTMGVIAHEAFHVFQDLAAAEKGANVLDLLKYPSLSPENNAAFALEGELLREAIIADTGEAARDKAEQWLALRSWRRARLAKELVAYEDGTEFSEGIAKYIEYRMLHELERREPNQAMWLVQGFRGYRDLTAERQTLLEQMVKTMGGRTNVNNDPFGASPIQFRLYFSGMGVAALLDRLEADWKKQLFQPEATLSDLAANALRLSHERLSNLQQEVVSTQRFAELLEEKRAHHAKGQQHIQELLRRFEDSPTLVLDYSKLSKPRVGLGFTPFGVLYVDDDRTVFRLIPIRGLVGALTFSEDAANPVLHDYRNKRIHVLLSSEATEEGLSSLFGGERWRSEVVEVQELKLPGVSANKVKARFRLEGKKLVLELQD